MSGTKSSAAADIATVEDVATGDERIARIGAATKADAVPTRASIERAIFGIWQKH